MDARLIGAMGEQQAARFLRKKGYDVLSANFSSNVGEIDLVCQYKGEIIFCEVKTRTAGGMFPPADAVDYRKQECIKSTAAAYISKYKLGNVKTRYDILEVIVEGKTIVSINHIENAF